MNFLKKVFDHEYKELTKFQKIADEIEKLDAEMSEKSDEELKAKTKEFQERLQNGETLEDIKVEAFAVAREAAFRVIGEKPYYVQILGGLAIHYGNIAEMKTGEGKTLTSTMPAYLNALTGKGVHIITVNEYLAGRDAEWMGNIYRFLGLTVGVNYRELSSQEKREAYQCDIMYSTNNEIGFDYLRDNMVVNAESRVQRKLNFAIVDEVDSVLIDEARTPLIISGGRMQSAKLYTQADRFVKSLKENDGYIYDEKTKAVTLDEKGIAKAEKAFGVDNIYDMEHTNLVHHINQALRANYAMKVDVDYVVADGKIVIVDQFTGRLMQGRNYSDGLHQAIEAKEGVEIQEETKTLATITFQNLFRMYDKLAGMTGTAKTEEEEFRDIYNMYVICIPTNKPVIRKDYGDLIFATAKGKYKAIVNEIVERHKTGQPVLVGTVAVETSELISSMLKKKNIPHEVLNAKNNAREAEIIAKAGEKGAVTIATNMAGRGTDIKLTDEVKELGGLCVIGTERHESRRIDNQLRGRAGRQGDPGFSQFCVSFEDDLMVRFGTDRAKALLQRVGFSDDMSIRNKALSSSIESAQRRVEGNNFDIRKTLLQYDDVINKQREIIYNKRNEILDSESISDTIKETIHNHIEDLVHEHIMPEGHLTEKDLSEIVEAVNENLLRKDMKVDEIENMDIPEVVDYIFNRVDQEYVDKMSEVPDDIRNEFEKAVALRVIDTHWMEHINTMSHLREGIHLRGYAQEDPLRAYTTEGYELFDRLLYTIDKETTIYLLRAEVRQNTERKEVAKGEAVRDPQKEKKRQPKKVKKVGRNDPCPCGSGKKYKQCCGK
ncbi:MAG TPA: preprotein translocase subunit SecA [Candidatus Fimihabitans intestinipullorum]|uniref:Protein translocase subunit SecA n=1 Tax=Candidatus Fimihabitans intestinipullorum TaxID=2840820 RepID=A0A9D1HTJ6_9BACT|nr:preprotein translocase subunit SecA [Candidatus Fimihabitans intestinipullorum]